MKKTLLTIALLFAATQAFAALSNAGGISNWKAQKNSNGDVVLGVIPTDASGNIPSTSVAYASITFTATGAAANGVQIIAAVAGKTIVVVGWSISTDTAGRITLHHQSGAATRSNSASNIIGGGIFGANGGERGNSGAYPGLAVNQPVCADFSAAMTGVEVVCEYYTY